MRDGMLEFKDAPMFGRVMRDADICKEVLERFLGFAIERIEYLNAEQVLDPATDAKGVRLDVFAKGTDAVFDIEMQVASTPSLGKRLRYYQASIDQACLDKGCDYDALGASYIIFVCDFDAYGKGLPAYHLERACLEDASVDVSDASHWLVLNACAWDKDEDARRSGLLNYIHTSKPADDVLVSKISCAVKSANSDAKWRESAVGFMTVEHSHRVALRDAHREGVAEGLERGLAEGIEQGEARGMIRGEARFGKLADILLDEKRIDDLKRAADDSAYRDALFQEYGL